MAAPAPVELQFATALLRRLKKPVTAIAVKNLVGWMRAEGGHTHNSARWNFLNTTQNMPGSGDTGSQGNISVFRSLGQGVEATARTLTNGRYGSILSSLNADPTRFASAVNSTPWGTKTNFGSLSRSISVPANLPAGQAPAPPPTPGRSTTGAPGAVTSSSVPGGYFGLSPQESTRFQSLLGATSAGALAGQMPGPQFAAGLGEITRAVLGRVQAGQVATPAKDPSVPRPPPVGPSGGLMVTGAIPGSPVPGQSFHASSHQTSGLAGYPAYDYMAPAGTKVAAPVGGKIVRLSGKDPSRGGSPGGPLGYSIYLQGKDGKSYFLTHLDKIGVKVGQRVRQGQQIAVVAAGPASWSSPHVHMGVHG